MEYRPCKKKNQALSRIESTHIFAKAPLYVPLGFYNFVSNLSPYPLQIAI